MEKTQFKTGGVRVDKNFENVENALNEILARVQALEEKPDMTCDFTKYTTNPMKQYPLLAAAVSLSSSATAWNWGTTVEIVPVSTITSDFIIVGIYVQAATTVTVDWQVQLMHGSGDEELMTVAGASESDTSAESGMIFLPLFKRIPANDRIRAKVTDSLTSAESYRIRVCYLEV